MATVIIGIVSDTHGHLSREALYALRGEFDDTQVVESLVIDGEEAEGPSHDPADLVIHAGDIGGFGSSSQEILDSLGWIAPLHAVLGNCDYPGCEVEGEPVMRGPLFLEACGMSIAVVHEPEYLQAALRAEGQSPRVMIHGHTHTPRLERRGDGIILCPGSPHRPRGWQPVKTVARLALEDGGKLLRADIIRI